MAEKEYTWHKLADTMAALAIPEQGLLEMEIAGKKLCIALVKDQLFACTALCPHAGGRMAQGYTDALGNIVCPIHRYKFDLRNGRNSSGEGYYLKTFPVQVREDGIFVGFEKNNILGWLK
jgi:nitrite reductase/ring-hydroxylating ferredoxin subunit